MKNIVSIFKYGFAFIIVYLMINLWRAPSLPDTPPLSYTTFDNQTVDVIAQSYHQPVLVYFWGMWCSVCRFTTPSVEQIHKTGQPVITIATRSDSTTQLVDYLNQHQLDFVVINDLDGRVFDDWGAKVTPSFVILKNGNIHQSFAGITPLWLLKLRLSIAQIY